MIREETMLEILSFILIKMETSGILQVYYKVHPLAT